MIRQKLIFFFFWLENKGRSAIVALAQHLSQPPLFVPCYKIFYYWLIQ